ncbi:hypothetical protein [Ilumatobacter coccineus]|nr:hypothetical protein [Ilumatobacter coccineus]
MISRLLRSTMLLGLGAIALGACGGGDDGGGPIEPVELQTYNGTVQQILSDDLTLDYTVDLPAGFEIGEFASESQQVWEDPDVEFGVQEISARLAWTTVEYDADTLVDDISVINDDRQLLDSGTEAEFSYVTYATPSTSSDAIFSASAQTSRTLAPGSVLICTATWSTGIDDEWSDDDVATVAAQALDICRSYDAA